MFKLKKIYIVLTHTGTNLSKIIKSWTKDEFSHVSIALDEDLKEMYSFGRLHPYNPFWAGLVHEVPNEGTYKRFFRTKANIYSIEAIFSSEYALTAASNSSGTWRRFILSLGFPTSLTISSIQATIFLISSCPKRIAPSISSSEIS